MLLDCSPSHTWQTDRDAMRIEPHTGKTLGAPKTQYPKSQYPETLWLREIELASPAANELDELDDQAELAAETRVSRSSTRLKAIRDPRG